MANTNPKRNSQWFYGIMVIMVIAGYVIVSFLISTTQSCSGRRSWEWKVPPGFVCKSGPQL